MGNKRRISEFCCKIVHVFGVKMFGSVFSKFCYSSKVSHKQSYQNLKMYINVYKVLFSLIRLVKPFSLVFHLFFLKISICKLLKYSKKYTKPYLAETNHPHNAYSGNPANLGQ